MIYYKKHLIPSTICIKDALIKIRYTGFRGYSFYSRREEYFNWIL